MRNPFLAYPVSQGWSDAHPAVDYATPIGVQFTAPAAGVYIRRPDELARIPGAAGIHGDLQLADGRRIRFCHLERHIAPSGARVNEETVLAVTGNTGYVLPSPTRAKPNNGSHMHTTGFHADGTRWNWTLDTQGEDMDANQAAQLDAIYKAVIKPYGSQLDAIVNVIRGEVPEMLKSMPPGVIDYDKLADAIVRRVLTGK